MIKIMDYEQKYKKALGWMQSLYTGLHGKTREEAETYFPELKESEDERIRKELYDFITCQYGSIDDIHYHSWISWITKHRQETIEQDTETHDLWVYIREWNGKFGRLPKDEDELAACIDYVMKRQKPADKIEPKFKVGDCVVYNRNDSSKEILYVYDIRDGRYYFNDNIHFSWSIKDCDEKCHLWTIQDAKDGDVLKEDSCMFIVEKMKSEGTAIIYCCLFDDGDFDLTGSTLRFDVDSTYPATKEQRELLFQKMKEAGYEWDAEKKELNMISAQSSWSEEDEKFYNSALWHIKNSCGNGGKDSGEYEVYNWLKSLKDRVQPQLHWKPSKEQLEALKYFISFHKSQANATVEGWEEFKNLESLYNDLKSL